MEKRAYPGRFLRGNQTEDDEYNITEAKERLLKRNPDSNKGSYGKLLTVCGSPGMAGAALLCSEAAYRTGCGLVYADTPEENRIIIQSSLPEAVFIRRGEWKKTAVRFTAAVAGPGLSTEAEAEETLEELLVSLRIPLVLDADALNLISASKKLERLVRDYPYGVIVTPHMGELSRLLKADIGYLKENRVEAARELAERLDCICVSKDSRTLVYCEGREPFLCTAGNDGMATGGSGDVLAGIIGGAVAQSPGELFDAAVLGVSIHAMAGDIARDKLGSRYMLARNIIEGMSEVLK